MQIDNYKLAEKGARAGNFIIDQIFIFIIVILTFILIFQFYPEINDDDSIQLELLYIIFTAIYYFTFELTLNKTPGKFLTKTRVIDISGNNPSTTKLILRTLTRFIPFEMISFLFGTKGLHDLLSKTVVIKDKL